MKKSSNPWVRGPDRVIDEKTGGRKSLEKVPLRPPLIFLFETFLV
jgi:hypothetical protein